MKYIAIFDLLLAMIIPVKKKDPAQLPEMFTTSLLIFLFSGKRGQFFGRQTTELLSLNYRTFVPKLPNFCPKLPNFCPGPNPQTRMNKGIERCAILYKYYKYYKYL